VLVLAIACAASAAAWIYLVLAHGGFWLTGQRLPPAAGGDARRAGNARPGAGTDREPETEPWPAVAAVVPARNEAESLPVTLPALLAQDYPGELRVFLVDDNSDDGTGAVAAELGEKAARDALLADRAPLTVVAGRPRPDGWAGKVWAMAQGFAAAAGAAEAGDDHAAGAAEAGKDRVAGPAPEYVLFTDADIAWGPHALADGPAARADRVGADDRARLRLLFRPALPVPQGQ
jgi:cellulose synthase/poly-beta-1,6-N-acetylglucosamine synthase-like glycosyltransferase